MKKLIWIISLIPLIVTLFVLNILPESVPMHFDSDGNVNRMGSKYEQLLFPVIILALALWFTLMMSFFKKKAENASTDKLRKEALNNVKVLGIVGVATAVLQGALHGVFLYGAVSMTESNASALPFDAARTAGIIIGILLIILGNIIPKTRRNSLIGFRTPWSLYNDTTWRLSNLFAGYAMIIAGAAVLVLSALFSSTKLIVCTVIVIFLSCLVSMIYAHNVYLKQIASSAPDGK